MTTSEKPMVVALFPYEHLTFNKISRLLAKRNIKTIYIPRKKKTSCSLRLIKDNLGRKTSGVCVRARVRAFVGGGGDTSRTIDIRCQKHTRHLRHGQTEKSAVAEHVLNTGHEIKFEKTRILNRTNTYMDQIVKEAIEIRLHPEHFNKESGFILSRTW